MVPRDLHFKMSMANIDVPKSRAFIAHIPQFLKGEPEKKNNHDLDVITALQNQMIYLHVLVISSPPSCMAYTR